MVAQLTTHSEVEGDDVSGVLQQIEAIGWSLFDIGYVYQPLRERVHALTTSNIITGNIVASTRSGGRRRRLHHRNERRRRRLRTLLRTPRPTGPRGPSPRPGPV